MQVYPQDGVHVYIHWSILKSMNIVEKDMVRNRKCKILYIIEQLLLSESTNEKAKHTYQRNSTKHYANNCKNPTYRPIGITIHK